MAHLEKTSSTGSDPQVHKATNAAYLIDERRRAALAEIDNAKFS
jgi:PHS family inorganic phosphate transporter-like MFS transporter